MTATEPILWLVIVAGGLGTLALKASFIVVVGRVEQIPPRVERALEFVPAAVLAALVLPAVLVVEPTATTFPTVSYSPKLPAAALAALVAWKTENVPATIAVGMVALWTLEAL